MIDDEHEPLDGGRSGPDEHDHPSGYRKQVEALGRVAGSFAHDFNNILAAILGSAELALESSPDPDVRGDLEMIVSSAKRGMGIVERLLGFSRHRTLDRKAYAISDLCVGPSRSCASASRPASSSGWTARATTSCSPMFRRSTSSFSTWC